MKLYIFPLALVMFGCGPNEQTSDSSEPAKAPIYSKANLTFGCYRMVVDKDSAIMQLNLRGADSVTGTLQYNRYEKDDNAGDFAGKLDSNKVIGWYKFQSEGIVTVRQVIFKIIGDKLAEGYGDLSTAGDTAYFAYPHTLNYEEMHPFQKISCPDSLTNKP